MPNNQPSLFGGSQEVESNPFETKPTPAKKARDNHGLLALDLATITGWCDANGSGSWDFTTVLKKEKNAPIRAALPIGTKKYVRFEKTISEYLDITKPRIVVIEKPFIYKSKKRRPNFISFEFAGIMKLMCASYNILMFEYHVQHVKKFATGNGQADKDYMVASCKRYGVVPVDHNEADALHLYHLAIEDLKLKI